jgi:hypothetical protein
VPEEARELIRWVPRQMILEMDPDRIRNRKGPVRDYEADAPEAFAAEEKIYG